LDKKKINEYWRMGGITTAAVEDYIYSILPPRDEVLADMEAEAPNTKFQLLARQLGACSINWRS